MSISILINKTEYVFDLFFWWLVIFQKICHLTVGNCSTSVSIKVLENLLQSFFCKLDRVFAINHKKLSVVNLTTSIDIDYFHHGFDFSCTHVSFRSQGFFQFFCWDNSITVCIEMFKYFNQCLFFFCCKQLRCNKCMDYSLEFVFEPKAVNIVYYLISIGYWRISLAFLYLWEIMMFKKLFSWWTIL